MYSENQLLERFNNVVTQNLYLYKKKELYTNHKLNPHTYQCFLNETLYECKKNIKFERILTDNMPTSEYRRRKGEVKTVRHWGQRKLLLAEIEFLTRFLYKKDEKKFKVVYAGAAPGTHIEYLSYLFDNITLDLYDPASFSVRGSEKIKLFNDFFTDKTAKKYENQSNILFISDIRSADWKSQEEEDVEEEVKKNMESQKNWFEIMKPIAGLFKFRLPWTKGTTEYLKGDIYLPVFGPVTTSETRLMVSNENGYSYSLYDNKKYENQMFYFNTNVRPALYLHKVNNMNQGLDHCYDCTSEVYILWKYLTLIKKFPEDDINTWLKIAEMNDEISISLSSRLKMTIKLSDRNLTYE